MNNFYINNENSIKFNGKMCLSGLCNKTTWKISNGKIIDPKENWRNDGIIMYWIMLDTYVFYAYPGINLGNGLHLLKNEGAEWRCQLLTMIVNILLWKISKTEIILIT